MSSGIIGRIPQDANRYPVLAGLSTSDGATVTSVYVEPSTHALRVTSASGSSTEVTQGTSPWVISGTVDTELPTAAAITDTNANPTAPFVASALTIYNGTNWPRARSASASQDVDGTRVLGVGIAAQLDDTATTTISENNIGLVRMTPARALMTEQVYSYSRVTADGQVKGSAGFIHTVTFSPTGSVTAGTVTIYDSTTETGTIIMSVALPATTFTPFSVRLDVNAATGIYVGYDGTVANVQTTLSYR